MSDAARSEWERALRCLASAHLLLEASDAESAVSRAYYSVFHGVTALFLGEGREFGKHEAVEAAVHRDLVRAGRVDASFGRAYSRLRELRMIGDYGVGSRVERADAESALGSAEGVIAELRKLSAGLLP